MVMPCALCNRLFHAANNVAVETNLVSFNVALSAARLNIEQWLTAASQKLFKDCKNCPKVPKSVCVYLHVDLKDLELL